jgi:hypothetical protein
MKEQEKKGSEHAHDPDSGSGSEPAHECAVHGKDYVVPAGPPGPWGGVPVYRHRSDHTIERAVIIPGGPPEGMPMVPGAEIVKLRDDVNGPGYEVKTEFRVPGKTSHGGPAQVATREYRDNWEAVFGCKGANTCAEKTEPEVYCKLCLVKPVAYPGAVFCGAGCSARWEGGARPRVAGSA